MTTEPAKHYADSLYRPDFTACGKEKTLVEAGR